MGACVSTPSKKIISRRKYHHRSSKCREKISGDINKMRKSDAGTRVTDFSLSEFVHMDFEKAATTTCRRSEVTKTFHLTQLQWLHSQIDANGIYTFLTSNAVSSLIYFWQVINLFM